MNCFTRSIHAPGFGSSFIHPGWAERKSKGHSSRSATDANIARITHGGLAKGKSRGRFPGTEPCKAWPAVSQKCPERTNPA